MANKFFLNTTIDTIINLSKQRKLDCLISESVIATAIYFLALHHKSDYFITRNKPDLKKAASGLPVFTPKQFLQHYNSNDL